MDLQLVRSLFKEMRCCVVIPTYNNEKTLKKVLNGVLIYTDHVFVVNDGSTDSTSTILSSFPKINRVDLLKNNGKGHALKTGFKVAVSHGFNYAITLDSDGQHFPSDIPVFIEELSKRVSKNALLIGDRNMNNADVFEQSAKGNRVSSYWVHAVTGLQLSDSQSGFRLYPIKQMESINFFEITKKFEFEIEAIVRCHWAGINISLVPIKVLYDAKERVSHFRPFLDISRIVILITWFLLVRFFYIIPRDFIRRLKNKGLRRFVVEDFLRNSDSPKKKALSIALGVFIGLSPLWGFHTIIVIFLAILLRLNKVIAFAFSNISLPPFIPLVLFLSVQTGNLVLGKESSFTFHEIKQNFSVVQQLETYLIGSIVLSISCAIIFGLIGYLLLTVFEKKTQLANA